MGEQVMPSIHACCLAPRCAAPLSAHALLHLSSFISRLFMRDKFKSHFKDADVRYIDPSYIIR